MKITKSYCHNCLYHHDDIFFYEYFDTDLRFTRHYEKTELKKKFLTPTPPKAF